MKELLPMFRVGVAAFLKAGYLQDCVVFTDKSFDCQLGGSEFENLALSDVGSYGSDDCEAGIDSDEETWDIAMLNEMDEETSGNDDYESGKTMFDLQFPKIIPISFNARMFVISSFAMDFSFHMLGVTLCD